MNLVKIKVFGYELIIRKVYNRKAYMKKYQKLHSAKLLAYNRVRYKLNVNGTRDKHLKRAKLNKLS